MALHLTFIKSGPFSSTDNMSADRPSERLVTDNNFKIRNISVLAYANGFTQWIYTGGTVAEVTAVGFLNGARDMVKDGDVVTFRALDGTAQRVIVNVFHNVNVTTTRLA